MSELVRLDDLDALMQRVRADVEARKNRADARNAELDRAEASPPPVEAGKQRYTASELLAHYDVVFMRAAHLALLGREPAGDDAARLLQQLRLGKISRIDVIDAIAATDEAQARGTRVSGLWHERFLDRFRRSALGRKFTTLARITVVVPRLASELQRAVSRIEAAEQRIQQLDRTLAEAQEARQASEAALLQRIDALTRQLSELGASEAADRRDGNGSLT